MDALYNALPLVLEILLPVLTLLIAYGVRAFVKKMGAEEKIDTDALVDKIVGRAVDCVEQLGAAAHKYGQQAIKPEDKLATAINLIVAEMNKLGLPVLTGEILRMKVEAYIRRREEAK